MKLNDYLRTSEAAEFLGVSPGTVRNWEKNGKLHARRLPQNGYRLFLKKDLEAVLRSLEGSGEPSRPSRRSTGKKRA
jgi:excisionase family DNA binding protein